MLELSLPKRDRNAEASPLTPRVQGLEADVVVIGAGVTGLTAALALKRASKRVVVLDAGTQQTGESSRTTAHLTEVLDMGLATLLARLGRDDARLLIEGQRQAIDQIEGWVGQLGVSCGFQRLPGYLYAARDDKAQQQVLEAESRAALELGYGDIRTQEIPASFPITGALRFDNQAQLRPRPYLAALESQIIGNGSLVVRGVRAQSIEDAPAGNPCRISTTGGELFADRVIVATHVPWGDEAGVHGKLTAYRTYAIAAPTDRPLGALLWDLATPYHYARTVRIGDRDYLVVGGGDHLVGQVIDTDAILRKLSAYARDQFGALDVTHRWSGQIIETTDGLPLVGPRARGSRILIATGLSGNGFTTGTLAGLVLADAVRGRENTWARLLAPDRPPSLAALGRRVGRNLAAAKRRLRRRTKNEPRRIEDLPPDAAMVTRRNRESIAVYRQPGGALLALPAVCSRRDGQLRWNSAEKSWDCPSCGSRFTLSGGILNGPAAVALRPRTLDDPRGVAVSAVVGPTARAARAPAYPRPAPPPQAADDALRARRVASSGPK